MYEQRYLFREGNRTPFLLAPTPRWPAPRYRVGAYDLASSNRDSASYCNGVGVLLTFVAAQPASTAAKCPQGVTSEAQKAFFNSIDPRLLIKRRIPYGGGDAGSALGRRHPHRAGLRTAIVQTTRGDTRSYRRIVLKHFRIDQRKTSAIETFQVIHDATSFSQKHRVAAATCHVALTRGKRNEKGHPEGCPL